MATTLEGNILTPQGWLLGHITFDDHVLDVHGEWVHPDENDAPRIMPGFVDLHVHGGGGCDVMQAGAATQIMARMHARHGTTSLLATTMTAPLPEIEAALAATAAACAHRAEGAARVLGVHLEGPYISPERLGAQPGFAAAGVVEEVLRLHALCPIRLVTLAPEVSGHLDLVRALVREGMRVQLGHSNGSYEDALAAMERGASGFTHLFNAMTGLHHRAPGVVGAALAHAEYAELIPDLLHVHPGAMHVALRAIPRLFCVTDATAAAGMPDGDYLLGRQTVHKCLGGVRLPDGTLAGSTLTMDQALRNLVGLGLDLAEASRRVSTYAADFVGEAQRGRLRLGAWADIVVLNSQLQVQQVFVEGEMCDLTDA